MKEAAQGMGIDRHLLGLRCMQQPGEPNEFFQDPVFFESMNFRLSTSNMSPGTKFYGGFGPVVADGYGINYAIQPEAIKFSISAKTNQKTNAYKYREILERTIKDVMILFPKRSEIWGMNWKADQFKERKEDAYFEQMKRRSDKHHAKLGRFKRR
jgi:carnitine O-acetyltransferase